MRAATFSRFYSHGLRRAFDVDAEWVRRDFANKEGAHE